jgi:hypothetical protein
VATSRAKINASQIDGFARRLQLASELIDEEGAEFEDLWGERWAEEMRDTVAVGPGDPVHIRDEIRQVEPGGITFGRAFWWRFLERGTSKMAPQPFIRPAMQRIRTPARKDAGERAVRLIQRGR